MAWRLGILLVWAALGCGQRGAPPANPPPLTTVTAAQLRQAVTAQQAPVVLVNMWATWCGPCRLEFPDLVRLEKNYHDRGLRVLFVSWDEKPEEAQEFLAKRGVDYESYWKDTNESNTKFIDIFEPKSTGAFPTTMIYDAAGKLRKIHEGPLSYAEFEKAVQEALKPKSEGES